MDGSVGCCTSDIGFLVRSWELGVGTWEGERGGGEGKEDGRGGKKKGEGRGGKEEKRGKRKAYTMVGLQIINLLAEDERPDVLAQELDHVERVGEAGAVAGEAASSKIGKSASMPI